MKAAISLVNWLNEIIHLFQVDIIDGKTSESELDLSLEYNSINKDSNRCEQRLNDTLSVARREPEGKDNDSINTVSSVSADANKMVPLG